MLIKYGDLKRTAQLSIQNQNTLNAKVRQTIYRPTLNKSSISYFS
jgi:hypothetical protein